MTGPRVDQMHRVLRPGGRLVLLGHVASPHRPVRALQHLIEHAAASHRRPADSQTRHALPLLRKARFTVPVHRNSRGGIIQQLLATKP